MPDIEDISAQQELLRAHRRTLATLLNQQAMLGVAYAPPAVGNGIAEARASIRRIKEVLRGWGADVEDLPDDEEAPAGPAPASPSAQIGAGLEALAELMRSNEARDAVVVYQASFDESRHEIRTLGGYKKLHDLFQQLEDRHTILHRCCKGLPDDTSAWDDVEINEPELFVITEQLLEFAGEPPFVTETAIWTPKLRRAQGNIRAALETSDADGLKAALARMKEVIEAQISRIDTRLVGAANAMRLATLVTSMRTVCDQIAALNLADAAARLDEFRAGVDALAAFDTRLTALVALHTSFQSFDDELRRVEHDAETDVGSLADGWLDLAPMSAALCAAASDDWAQRLSALGGELEQALQAGDMIKTRRAFGRYRSHATVSFNRIDHDLRDLCDDLQRVGAPLDQVLRLSGYGAQGVERIANG